MQHRHLAWQRTMQYMNKGRIGHPSRFDAVTQWERSLDTYYWQKREMEWQCVAQNRTEWKRTEEQWVAWKLLPKWTKKTVTLSFLGSLLEGQDISPGQVERACPFSILSFNSYGRLREISWHTSPFDTCFVKKQYQPRSMAPYLRSEISIVLWSGPFSCTR